jgi:hypothetical protein
MKFSFGLDLAKPFMNSPIEEGNVGDQHYNRKIHQRSPVTFKNGTV